MKSVRTTLISKEGLKNDPLFEFSLDIDQQTYSFVAARAGEELKVWLNICPHAGRRLDYAPGKFLQQGNQLICAAHGASFDLSDGLCVAGPCRGASLIRVRVQEQKSDYALEWSEESFD
jgi:nitrite reductase/ring-hydroxylating ferredoxin subunit